MIDFDTVASVTASRNISALVSVAKETKTCDYPQPVRNKSLTAEQNDALRAVVRRVIDAQFSGKVSVAAAAEPKVSHSLLFEFLDGRRGAGMKLLEWISARTGRGIDDLLGRNAGPLREIQVEYDERYPNRAAAIALVRGEVSEAAIRRVQSTQLLSASDRPRWWWVAELRRVDEDLQLDAGGPDPRNEALLADYRRRAEAMQRSAGIEPVEPEGPPPPGSAEWHELEAAKVRASKRAKKGTKE